MDALLVRALNRVRERSGGAGSRAYLAAVGNWLRSEGVDVSSLRPLGTFMASLSGYCRLSGEHVVFGEGDVPQGSAASGGAAAAGPADVQAQDRATSSDVDRRLVLRLDLWRAMVNDRPEIVSYLDLGALVVVEAAKDAAEGPVAAEPERHVLIPTVRTEEQRDFVLGLLRESFDAAGAEALVPPVTSWMRTFVREAPPDLQRRVLEARRAWIVQRARDWLRAHGLPEDRFVHRGRPDAGIERSQGDGRRDVGARASAARSTSLRDALHRALDRMTDAELESLRVPARLLLD